MNNNQVKLADLWPLIEEQIKSGKSVQFSPRGISMLPLIRQGVDMVVFKMPPKKLKKYDLPLFMRENGQFVLHRVVGENKDGYIMCGDNQVIREYGIKDTQILAIVEGVYRDDKYIPCTDKEYLKYCKKRVKQQHLKYFVYKGRALLLRILQKITKKYKK